MKSCSTLIFRPPCFLPPQHDAKRTSNLRTEGLVQRRPQPVSPKKKCMPLRPAAVRSFLSRFSPPSPSGGARRKVDALQKKLSFLPSSLRVSFLRSHTSMISTKFSGFWTPPPCSLFGLNHKTKFMQPRLHTTFAFGYPPPLPLSANVINGSPLITSVN